MGEMFRGVYIFHNLYLVPTFWYHWKALSMYNQSCFVYFVLLLQDEQFIEKEGDNSFSSTFILQREPITSWR